MDLHNERWNNAQWLQVSDSITAFLRHREDGQWQAFVFKARKVIQGPWVADRAEAIDWVGEQSADK